MSQDAQRLSSLGQWLFRRYVRHMEEPEIATPYAEAMFFLRYGCEYHKLPEIWRGFQRELRRLANSELAKDVTIQMVMLGF